MPGNIRSIMVPEGGAKFFAPHCQPWAGAGADTRGKKKKKGLSELGLCMDI